MKESTKTLLTVIFSIFKYAIAGIVILFIFAMYTNTTEQIDELKDIKAEINERLTAVETNLTNANQTLIGVSEDIKNIPKAVSTNVNAQLTALGFKPKGK